MCNFPKKQMIQRKNKKIICNSGYYIPNDNISICLKCSVENWNKCYGTIKNNTCISCFSPFIPIYYENNKIKKCKYLYSNNEEIEEEEKNSIIIEFENEEENTNIINDFENEEENNIIYFYENKEEN